MLLPVVKRSKAGRLTYAESEMLLPAEKRSKAGTPHLRRKRDAFNCGEEK
jgi:hypothetical protein